LNRRICNWKKDGGSQTAHALNGGFDGYEFTTTAQEKKHIRKILVI